MTIEHDTYATQRSNAKANDRLSIIVPVYNEEEVVEEFYRRLDAVLRPLSMETEILFINDGSKDATLDKLEEIRKRDPRVGILDLSRNFGKEVAMAAGFDHACGDAVVVIDADLQDPPELIPQMLDKWREGYALVNAKRSLRVGESVLKRLTAHLFYRLMKHVGRVELPEDTGDFRLIGRQALESLKQLRERRRFTKGLFAWIGFPQTSILYHRDPRFAGSTKWNYWRLWNFALEGITSFTTTPLIISTYFGILIAVVSFIYGAYFIVRTLMFGNPVPGYPSLLVAVLFLGGVQLICLGIIGEYLSRMFDESKGRPLYLLQGNYPSQARSQAADSDGPRSRVEAG